MYKNNDAFKTIPTIVLNATMKIIQSQVHECLVLKVKYVVLKIYVH